jgi:hypothetical protein
MQLITSGHQQEEKAIATSVDELLALYDERFIEFAYWTLLGRSPDPEGLSHHLACLRQGASKIEMLVRIALSEEGRAFTRPEITGLSAAIRRFRLSRLPLVGGILRLFGFGLKEAGIDQRLRSIDNQVHKPFPMQVEQETEGAVATSVGELLALYDEPFIQSTYWTLLGRAPDSNGLSHFLGCLRQGTSKIEILIKIALSDEGRAFQRPEIVGLSAAIHRFRLSRFPLLGPFLRSVGLGWKDVGIEQRLRSIENQLYRIAQLQEAVQSSLALAQNDPPAVRSEAAQELEYIEELPPHSKRIYRQLHSALSHKLEWKR